MNKFAFLNKFAVQIGIVLILAGILNNPITTLAGSDQNQTWQIVQETAIRERMARRELKNRESVNPTSSSEVISSMSPEERRLLRQHIHDVGRELYPIAQKVSH